MPLAVAEVGDVIVYEPISNAPVVEALVNLEAARFLKPYLALLSLLRAIMAIGVLILPG